MISIADYAYLDQARLVMSRARKGFFNMDIGRRRNILAKPASYRLSIRIMAAVVIGFQIWLIAFDGQGYGTAFLLSVGILMTSQLLTEPVRRIRGRGSKSDSGIQHIEELGYALIIFFLSIVLFVLWLRS